jgi:hypothetical protein
MESTNYKALQKKGESAYEYRHRLLQFAIEYRIKKGSNYRLVADQIVAQNMVRQFTLFTPPPIPWDERVNW